MKTMEETDDNSRCTARRLAIAFCAVALNFAWPPARSCYQVERGDRRRGL